MPLRLDNSKLWKNPRDGFSEKAQSQHRACPRDKHEDGLRGFLLKNKSNLERIKWTMFH
jgi:hypothetical protein